MYRCLVFSEVIHRRAHSKYGVGSGPLGEGSVVLVTKVEGTALGWFHTAAITSLSCRWKDNMLVLGKSFNTLWTTRINNQLFGLSLFWFHLFFCSSYTFICLQLTNNGKKNAVAIFRGHKHLLALHHVLN